ncbi:MAG: hypothetical protein EOM20_18455 [Spartobacteria bacterium]|nr:hypothetical protein [Spartobacteria bacterium]
MTKIDTFELPSDLAAYLVDEADTEHILLHVRHDKALCRGFQPTKVNIGHFRSRIRNRLAGQAQLSEELRLLLARAGFNYRFIVVLSERAIDVFFDDFLTACGREAFLSGLLVDDRAPVRKRAIDYLKQEEEPRGPSAAEVAAARARLSENLAAFLAYTGTLFDREAPLAIPVQNAESSDELAEVERQVQALNEELSRSRGEARKARALQKKCDTLEARIRTLEEEKASAQTALQQARQEMKLVEAREQSIREEKARLEESAGELILRGIEERTQALVHTWLREPLKAEGAVDDAPSVAALLEMADTVLSRQAEVDRHTGNLRILREQHAALTDAWQRVCAAAGNALNPLPDLKQAQERLERKINELQALLPSAPGAPASVAARLLARIGVSASEDEMTEMLDLLNRFEDYGLLAPVDLQRLHQAHQARMARMYAASWPNVVQGPIPKNTVLKLRKFISENRALLWLLDGCNILLGLDGPSGEGDRGFAVAREELIDRLAGMVRNADRSHVRIYFDSPERMDVTRAPNVKVVFSGGGEASQRADNAVLAFLEYARNENADIPIFLTTDDREFGVRAARFGAEIIRLQPFAALLVDVAEEK